MLEVILKNGNCAEAPKDDRCLFLKMSDGRQKMVPAKMIDQ